MYNDYPILKTKYLIKFTIIHSLRIDTLHHSISYLGGGIIQKITYTSTRIR